MVSVRVNQTSALVAEVLLQGAHFVAISSSPAANLVGGDAAPTQLLDQRERRSVCVRNLIQNDRAGPVLRRGRERDDDGLRASGRRRRNDVNDRTSDGHAGCPFGLTRPAQISPRRRARTLAPWRASTAERNCPRSSTLAGWVRCRTQASAKAAGSSVRVSPGRSWPSAPMVVATTGHPSARLSGILIRTPPP